MEESLFHNDLKFGFSEKLFVLLAQPQFLSMECLDKVFFPQHVNVNYHKKAIEVFSQVFTD